jgi:hypothetical protein
MRTGLIIIFLLSVVLTNAQEPKDVINGIVRDKDKAPLVGVSVYVKVNNRCLLATTSDANGKYSLQIPDSLQDFVLVYSYIGFEQREIKITRPQKKTDSNDKRPDVMLRYSL